MTGPRVEPPAGNGRVVLVLGRATGGIGVHVASLARGLPALGWQVSVLTTPETAERFDLASRPGVVVHPWWPAGRSPGQALRLVRAGRRLLREADIVHAHGHQAGLLSAALLGCLGPVRRRRVRRASGAPALVISWHNATLGSGPSRLIRAWTERAQARSATLITGASSDLVRRAADVGASRSRLAPVAAPLAGTWSADRGAGRREFATDLGLDPRLPWVLTVSRIAPQKNLPVLVDAAARLAADRAYQWIVVGDGDPALTGELRAQIAATGAPVRLIGARDDVPRLMGLSDVFVLSSAWEARALVVQEAMAAGLPVVATAVGGLVDLVDEAGLLVAPGDAGALAGAVGSILDDADLARRLSDASRRRFADLPGEHDVVRMWDATYRELLPERGKGRTT